MAGPGRLGLGPLRSWYFAAGTRRAWVGDKGVRVEVGRVVGVVGEGREGVLDMAGAMDMVGEGVGVDRPAVGGRVEVQDRLVGVVGRSKSGW